MKFRTNIYAATICQFLAALFLCWLTRFVFIIYNWDSVGISGFGESMRLSFDGLRFDLSAAAYFNALFIAMRVLPFRFAASRAWLRATGVVYCITNALLLAINLGDTPYYRFTGSRLRWSSFMDITADPNWLGVSLSYAVDYWWVFIAAGLFVAALVWLYYRVEISPPRKIPHWVRRNRRLGHMPSAHSFSCFSLRLPYTPCEAVSATAFPCR